MLILWLHPRGRAEGGWSCLWGGGGKGELEEGQVRELGGGYRTVTFVPDTSV